MYRTPVYQTVSRLEIVQRQTIPKLFRRLLGSLFVILGEHNLNGRTDNPTAKPIVRAVNRMIIHRQYNAQTFENDIALLELHAPIQDEPNVMPICLPSRETDVFDEATVTGFGKLKYGNERLRDTPRVSLSSSLGAQEINEFVFDTKKADRSRACCRWPDCPYWTTKNVKKCIWRVEW